jgi:hypothetical protein
VQFGCHCNYDLEIEWALWETTFRFNIPPRLYSLLSYTAMLHKVMTYSRGVDLTAPSHCTGRIREKLFLDWNTGRGSSRGKDKNFSCLINT